MYIYPIFFVVLKILSFDEHKKNQRFGDVTLRGPPFYAYVSVFTTNGQGPDAGLSAPCWAKGSLVRKYKTLTRESSSMN